ncbi:chymotrypsin-2-like [Temnothorax nylanderi]|uniref:chymotrypsin-2-like n=1 Tax=Temnothorax nylanderi TaxID=102681 RepID=UPI003A8A8658
MGNLQAQHAEQTIMSPLSTKVLLCIVLCLSMCQYTQSLYLGDNPIDAIVLDANNVFLLINDFGIGHGLLRSFSSVLMIPTQAFIHPQYARANNDIALLYMPQDIPFSNNIQPVKLAYYESFVNKDAYMVGWRENNTASESIVEPVEPIKLKYATFPIIENNVCRQYWPINDNHICTAAGFGQFACPERNNSDPLIVRKNGQDFQIGIMIYSDSCPSKRPYLFTKVSSYIDWIREVMKRH